MIKIYGLIKQSGFAIGDDYNKHLLGEFSAARAIDILKDRKNFIERWNENHITKMVQLIFETEEKQ